MGKHLWGNAAWKCFLVQPMHVMNHVDNFPAGRSSRFRTKTERPMCFLFKQTRGKTEFRGHLEFFFRVCRLAWDSDCSKFLALSSLNGTHCPLGLLLICTCRYSSDDWMLFARRTFGCCSLFGATRYACFIRHVLVIVDGFQFVQLDGISIQANELQTKWNDWSWLFLKVFNSF